MQLRIAIVLGLSMLGACAITPNDDLTVGEIVLAPDGAALMNANGAQIGSVHREDDPGGNLIRTTLGDHVLERSWTANHMTVSCESETRGNAETCDAASAATDRVAELAAWFHEQTSNLAPSGCWVTLDECYVGGYGCTGTGCTPDQTHRACVSLGARCKSWGY